ncbi:MAG: DUF423 domain-containing protein [Candidatus Sericytochromatia bacterium]|nr:DUF423 domain-containing protein [Candidatus Sericytochromatia bacterium]
MNQVYFAIGAFSAGLSVALHAVGAHILKGQVALGTLTPERLETWHTGTHYQFWHALAILAIATALHARLLRPNSGILLSMVMGTVLFSGSLYALVLSKQEILAAVAPLGGMIWIGAWLALAWEAWESRRLTSFEDTPA